MGLQAVLADGTVLDEMAGLRKDNTGYHLLSLFIGSEGTLGVVTAVAVSARGDRRRNSCCSPATPSTRSRCFPRARAVPGEILSAVEFLDAECVDSRAADSGTLRHPCP